MKRSPLRSHGKSETAKCKVRIQELLRQLALIRDGGCVLFDAAGTGNIPYCHSQDTKDGHMVMQYDHLNSRQFNVSYADLRLGVILCQGHHKWKHSSKRNEKEYDALVRQIIGPERATLWDRVENDRKTYAMSAWDWAKVEIALTKDLAEARANQTFSEGVAA
jgi:hypothetical protein